MKTTTLTIKVDYDPEVTDAESVAQAADDLLEAALSTPGIVEEYGDPAFDVFLVENDGVPILTETPANASPFRFREDTKIQDATLAFDQLTAASYYGFGFRQILIEDAEARKAAFTLLNRLRAHGAKGLT